MTLFQAIYILGYIASVLFLYFNLEKGSKITIKEIVAALIISALSWVSFILLLLFIGSDKVIFIKR